jgi:HEPN domain-containing protein
MRADISIDDALNDFAIRCFRDEGDADYISARMAFRAALDGPALWASQQTLEKYLKCIILLNRIPADHVRHDLDKALKAINSHAIFPLELTPATTRFIEHIDALGKFRYLEVSRVAFGRDIVRLDRAAWELRRYCTLDESPRLIRLLKGVMPPKIRIRVAIWRASLMNPRILLVSHYSGATRSSV